MDADMRRILTDHAIRYPSWSVEDLYKLIHQSAMGSEHALDDEVKVREWLLRELQEMGRGPEEPLLDPISPDGVILRVHLRPFARHGLECELLLDAFVRTAMQFRGSQKLVDEYRDLAVELALQGALTISARDVIHFFERMKANAFPAIHHSRLFESRYRPAYRVVASPYLSPEVLRVA
jgi:hypothetical protein